MLKSIRGETLFGSHVEDGEPVACGMAVVEREVVGLFDIVVHPQRRRRGHGRALVEGLLERASAKGAGTAYLQVLGGNRAARDLYGELGFEPTATGSRDRADFVKSEPDEVDERHDLEGGVANRRRQPRSDLPDGGRRGRSHVVA